MAKERHEVTYYPEIQNFIETQIKSNFRAKCLRELEMFWGIGELKSNLQRILSENPEKCDCAKGFIQRTPPLNLDIFALVTDGIKYELIILEVKKMKSAGLKEWSQLIGYCLVSGAKFGLLVNIDNGASYRLDQLLSTEEHLFHIRTIVGDEIRQHFLGFMQWDSVSKCFDYSNLGIIKSLSELTNKLISEFSQ